MLGQFSARASRALGESDAELRIDLAEVPFHGTRAQEELCGDLGIGVTVARQPGNLLLLSREVVARLWAPLSDSFTGSGQLAAGAVHEHLPFQSR